MQGWVQQSRCLTRYLLRHTGVCLAAVSKGERQPVPPSTEGDGEGVKGQHECILWSFKLSDITWPFSTLFNYGIFRLMGKKKVSEEYNFFVVFYF